MKTTVLILIILLSLTSQAQVFIGTGFHSRGFTMTGGYIYREVVEASVSADMPYSDNTQKGVYGFTVGPLITIKGKLFAHPSAGVARVRYKEFGFKPDPLYPQSTMTQIRKVKKIVGLEVGFAGSAGRLYLNIKHADAFYWGFGSKVYF